MNQGQGRAEWGFEQPDPAEDVAAHCRGLDQMTFKGPFQAKTFCESVPAGGFQGAKHASTKNQPHHLQSHLGGNNNPAHFTSGYI